MNENLNLVEILKDFPSGTKLYSTVFGEVEFVGIESSAIEYPIFIRLESLIVRECLTAEGKLFAKYDGECVLFPSREQRDWSKFKTKKAKFDPKTLQPFDRVMVIDSDRRWSPVLFSYLEYSLNYPRMYCFDHQARKVIPYNDDTKHLVGTTDEAPEYYIYWED